MALILGLFGNSVPNCICYTYRAQIKFVDVGCYVLTAGVTNANIFLDIAKCITYVYQRFGGTKM
jgi:hypothetical protein